MRSIKPVLICFGLVFTLLFTYLYNVTLVGSDTAMCRPVKMFPSYARILGFDQLFTKYASKYSLYLYREQGKDLKPTPENNFQLDGTPVLFIPGNAGSYRQARSIALKTTTMLYEQQYDGLNQLYGKLDFFTADFNEDFTAFHGRTMLDQAEYLNDAIRFILGLYQHTPVPPKSVTVIGHSMGGIVARVLLTLPNYVDESINTIITLSTPHAKLPLTFDRDIMKIYKAVNEFWQEGFFGEGELASLAHSRLKHLSLVLITGGLLDTVLPADYTTIKDLVPRSNGFTTFTSGIPGVWSAIDHLAIVWCDQLRTVIVKALLDIVDVNSAFKTVSLDERISKFESRFLTGFEPNTDLKGDVITLKIDDARTNIIDDKTTVSKDGTYRLSIEPERTFQLLSNEPGTIYLCNGESEEFGDTERDLTSSDTQDFSSLTCHDYSSALRMVPKPGVDSIKDSTIGDRTNPLYAIRLDPAVLKQYSDVILVDTNAIVESVVLDPVLVEPGLFGTKFTVPSNLRTTVRFQGVKSSIKSYDLLFEKKNPNPIVRQYINEETKWHIDNQINLNFHGESPYMGPLDEYLELEVWNLGNEAIDMKVSPNFLVGLKLLIIRYRITILGYGLLVNLLIFCYQLKEYDRTGKFPAYSKSMDKLLSPEYLKYLVLFITISILNDHFTMFRRIIAMINFESPESNALGVKNSTPIHFTFLCLSVFFNSMINLIISKGLILTESVTLPKTNNRVKNIVLGLMVILTVVYFPYQVTYIILVVVQALKLIKLTGENDINYNVIILMMMIWITPINVPIIVVLMHNLAVNWKTTFSSHHNILSIIPIIYIITYKRGIIKFKYINVIIGYLIYFSNYCIFYGSINTFWLYQLFNYLCIGLSIIDNDFIQQ